jgi:O-antigen biosynthesis protein
VDPEWQKLYEGAGVRVRVVSHSAEVIEPAYFGRARDVEIALRADPPDFVIAQDLGAPAYTALRLRRLGLAFERTSFVVFCHGTRQWITDVSGKVRVLPGALAVAALERASVELADAVVSPSAYLVDWMRRQGWKLPPQTFVIPHVSRAGATGTAPAPVPVDTNPVSRFAFFGRLEERKGVRPFVEALNMLEPELLERVEVEFLGRSTPAWPVERVTGLFSETTTRALHGVAFESALDQHEVLDRLRRPGTVAVVPSFEENSPNTIYECLENGIPFIASTAAGIRELVASEDHTRVLFDPTPDGIAQALRRVLKDAATWAPARPGYQDAESLERWHEVLTRAPRQVSRAAENPLVDVVIVHRSSAALLARCLAAVAGQSGAGVRVTVVVAGAGVPSPEHLPTGTRVVRSDRAASEAVRSAAHSALEGEWVLVLDEGDVAEPTLVETLVRAQTASGADVVTCGLFLESITEPKKIHLFLGEPRALGLLANSYGTVSLLRRSLLGSPGERLPDHGAEDATDPDWPFLARLSVDGAKIVSIPIPLVTRTARPGALATDAGEARRVLRLVERALPRKLRLTAELGTRLAAELQQPLSKPPSGLAARMVSVLREDGASGVARRSFRRLVPGRGR